MLIPQDSKTQRQAMVIILADCCAQLNKLNLDKETYMQRLFIMVRDRTGLLLTRADMEQLWCER